MKNPLVSIIILNYNGSIDTIECLESLEKQTCKNFEIILIDNGSRDDEFNQLKKFLKKSSLPIKLIRLKENKGFTGGNNIGVKYCKGKYIVCLNNDTVVENNWLEGLIKPFSQINEKLAAIGSLIMFYYNRSEIQGCGGRMNIFGQVKGLTENEATSKKALIVSGPSFIIKKEILKEIKPLFCEGFFPGYFEDVDLSWRIYNLGYKISVAPDSIVYHKGSVVSQQKGFEVIKGINLVRNKYLTFYRNLTLWRFLLVFPVLIIWDFVIIIKSLSLDTIKIRIKGIFGFFKNIKKVKHIGNGDFSFLDKHRYK